MDLMTLVLALKKAKNYVTSLIVNDTTTGGATNIASAETVKTLAARKANDVPITDTGANFTAEDVEGALAELAIGKLAVGSNSDFIENLATATDGQILASNGDGTAEFITLSGDTVIVNDLTTGGETSAASAETVKTLKTNADALQSQVIEKTSYGIISGLGVTQQTVADMTVKIATGVIYMANGTRFAPSAVAVQAVTAADATNPRIDIVYVNSSGVITYLAGTSAASPSAPSVPVGGQLIAEISVAANAETIVTANVQDRRKSIWAEAWIAPTLINSWANYGSSFATAGFYKDVTGVVRLKGMIGGGTTSTIAFTLPAGYRPLEKEYFASAGNVSVTIQILTSGAVYIYGSGLMLLGLGGVSFRAGQ